MYQVQNQNMKFNLNLGYAAYQYNPMQRYQQAEQMLAQVSQMQPQFLEIQRELVQFESIIMTTDVMIDGNIKFTEISATRTEICYATSYSNTTIDSRYIRA